MRPSLVGVLRRTSNIGKQWVSPSRYAKTSYEWGLDYKYMTKCCTTSTGSRKWTEEEMTASLDWNSAEDARIEAQVAAEGILPGNQRRGTRDIWRRVERYIEEQEAMYSARK
jgi:hypothetical protein